MAKSSFWVWHSTGLLSFLLLLLLLSVKSVFSQILVELHQLKSLWSVSLVFRCRIVALSVLGTNESDNFAYFTFLCHGKSLFRASRIGANINYDPNFIRFSTGSQASLSFSDFREPSGVEFLVKKVALITGANKGIGFETARQLAHQGYTVLVGARDATKGTAAANKIQSEGGDAHFIHVDLENPSTFAPAAEAVASQYGHLDALINNAGVNLDFGHRASEVDTDLVRKTFEINLFSQIEFTKHFIPLLEKSPAGRIVNLSSILGSLTLNSDPKSPIGDWRSLGYNASKAALNAYTAILSFDLRKTNIKVNAAHPGWVKTDLGGENAPMELEDGAKTSVWLATLPDDGPTGGYFHMQDRLPW